MEIAQILRKAGLRATETRIAVFSFLHKKHLPLSIADIAAALPKIDTVTIYRTIATGKELGIIKEISLGDGVLTYEFAPDGHGHHHVVCTSCNKIEDVTSCNESLLARQALREVSGFAAITGHSLEFFGLCKKCI